MTDSRCFLGWTGVGRSSTHLEILITRIIARLDRWQSCSNLISSWWLSTISVALSTTDYCLDVVYNLTPQSGYIGAFVYDTGKKEAKR